jgi:hypothetical protein
LLRLFVKETPRAECIFLSTISNQPSTDFEPVYSAWQAYQKNSHCDHSPSPVPIRSIPTISLNWNRFSRQNVLPFPARDVMPEGRILYAA